MKKTLLTVVLAAALIAPASLFAGNFDILSNKSANYDMTLNRNAATDAADIVEYNPAGTAFMPKGLHLDVSNQFLLKFYRNQAENSTKYKADIPTWLLPNIYASYNFGKMGIGNLAVNFNFGVNAGGGDLIYKDGITASNGPANSTLLYSLTGIIAMIPGSGVGPIDSTSSKVTVSSIYYNVGLGGAYSFLDDKLAVSAGVRIVIPRRSLDLKFTTASKGDFEAKYEYNAVGATPIIGVNYKPFDGLLLSLRYEAETKLEFKYKQKKLSGAPAYEPYLPTALQTATGIQDGKKIRMDLPNTFGLGAEYSGIPKLTVDVSGNLYLMNTANYHFYYYDQTTGAHDYKAKRYFTPGFDLGVGATYQVLDPLKVGAGVTYCLVGAKKKFYQEQALTAQANPPLDSVNFGLGGTFDFSSVGVKGLTATLSCLYADYLTNKTDSISTKKDVVIIGLGVGYNW
jgi:long-chain fatty acid transport protein